MKLPMPSSKSVINKEFRNMPSKKKKKKKEHKKQKKEKISEYNRKLENKQKPVTVISYTIPKPMKNFWKYVIFRTISLWNYRDGTFFKIISRAWFICLMAYQLLMGYLMPKINSFVSV